MNGHFACESPKVLGSQFFVDNHRLINRMSTTIYARYSFLGQTFGFSFTEQKINCQRNFSFVLETNKQKKRNYCGEV